MFKLWMYKGSDRLLLCDASPETPDHLITSSTSNPTQPLIKLPFLSAAKARVDTITSIVIVAIDE